MAEYIFKKIHEVFDPSGESYFCLHFSDGFLEGAAPFLPEDSIINNGLMNRLKSGDTIMLVDRLGEDAATSGYPFERLLVESEPGSDLFVPFYQTK